MPGQNADDKAGDQTTIGQEGLGASSASDSPKFSRDNDNSIDTVDQSSKADAKGQDGENGKGGKGADGADTDAKDGEKGKGDEARYDKDPAWQRIMKERDDAREAQIRAEAKLEVLDKGKGDDKGEDDGYKPLFSYEDVTKWTDDEIREKLEDNPKGFITNLFSQIVDETRKVLLTEKAQETKQQTVKSTFDKFAEKHTGDKDAGIPGFNDVWKSGEVKKYMAENPGHNAMSAYLEMTAEARERAIAGKSAAQLKADAEKKAEDARRTKQAKDGARSLGAGPGGAPKDAHAETLKNTKAGGGLISSMTQALLSRRSADG